MRIFSLISIAFLVSACSAATTGTRDEVAPTKALVPAAEIRKIVQLERARMWKDPDSVRDARAGDSHFCTYDILGQGGFSKGQASCMCIEANAKNSYGGYVGIRRTIAVVPENGPFQTMDGAILGFENYCQNLQPFPEINGGFVAGGPKAVGRRPDT